METFLLLEPSADIHLVLDPAFTNSTGQPLNNLSLKPWLGTKSGHTGFTYQPADAFTHFDLTAADQQIVTVANGILTPLKAGTVFMQARMEDPFDNRFYFYIPIRVMVHAKMDTWWFGNESVRVFTDPTLPHTQPSVYASFDNGAVIGDITAHDYVSLTSNHPLLFAVASDPNNPWRGRIRGITPGTGQLTGTLMNRQQQVQVKVENFSINNNKVLEPVKVDRTASPRRKFNILFVSEGFNNKAKFEEVCKKTANDMFAASKNSPYNLLKDDFNVWSVFQSSEEEGITVASRVCKDGSPMPYFGADDQNESGGFYTLKKLTELVGISNKTALQRGINPQTKKQLLPQTIVDLKTDWLNDPVAQELGMVGGKVPVEPKANEVVVNWMDQVPMNRIPQSKNTYYGFVAGNRPGEKQSIRLPKIASQNNVIIHRETWFIPTHADFNARLFTARSREWYIPNNHNLLFPPALDNRRWAPDLYQYEDTREPAWVRFFIKSHVTQFVELSETPIDPSFRLGEVWDKDIAPDLSTRSYNSSGLVCFLINSPLTGRSANFLGRFIGGIIGKWNGYKRTDMGYDDNDAAFREENPEPGVHKLFIEPHVVIDRDQLLGMVSHEFGHSFSLGDEYEDKPEFADEPFVGLFDNLVHHNQVKKDSQEHNFAKPIDPEKLPWSVLHRIKYSLTIAEPVTITNKNAFEAVVAPGDMDTVARIIGENEKVYLRRFIANFPGMNNRLLRIDPQETLNKDRFDELELSSELDTNTRKVTVKITTGSRPLEFPVTGPLDNLIPAGSVLYVPLRDEFETPRFLIEKEVMSFMRNTSYGGSAPHGRALSENFKENSNWDGDYKEGNLDPINLSQKNDTDYPASIPDFKGPCKKFRMIGAYEGGALFVGGVYRPTGACKMRDSMDDRKYNAEKEFCFVCKYLIVSRVNPSKLGVLDKEYPESKDEKWKRMTDNVTRQNEDMPSI